MEKGVIPERAIIVGYNGPTKWNVTSEGILKDTKQNLWQKFYSKRRKNVWDTTTINPFMDWCKPRHGGI